MSEPTPSGDLRGCLSIVALVLIIWALLFGVTIDGEHHGISCSCKKGVVIQ